MYYDTLPHLIFTWIIILHITSPDLHMDYDTYFSSPDLHMDYDTYFTSYDLHMDYDTLPYLI